MLLLLKGKKKKDKYIPSLNPPNMRLCVIATADRVKIRKPFPVVFIYFPLKREIPLSLKVLGVIYLICSSSLNYDLYTSDRV